MVSERRAPFWILLYAGIGTLFSAYLSVPTLLQGYCPLTEGCHYVFGFPACVLSLILFLALLGGATQLARANEKRVQSQWRARVMGVAGLGIILLGGVAIDEYLSPTCTGNPCVYKLLLPLCVYGLVFYIVALALAARMKK